MEEPLELIFLVRTQVVAKDLIVLKDGAAAGDCRGASGQASPDSCVPSRGKAGTTVVVKVLTSDASSIWEFRTPTAGYAAPDPGAHGHTDAGANGNAHTRPDADGRSNPDANTQAAEAPAPTLPPCLSPRLRRPRLLHPLWRRTTDSRCG